MYTTNIQIKNDIDFSIKHEPYVIKNYAQKWYAFKNWTFKYFEDLDHLLTINTVIGNATVGKHEIINIKLKDYIKNIVADNTDSYLTTFYLFKYFPELKKHIKYDNIKKNCIFYHLLAWIGPSGTITGFHADWSENLNVQIKGKKNWYLASPEYNDKMYINDRFERISITSQIDLQNLNDANFPLFRKVKVIKVTVDEGDAIYVPRGWWHYVESLEPSISVSVHYWRLGPVFKDLIVELFKVFLHDVGLFKKDNCACHTYNNKGKRIKRG